MSVPAVVAATRVVTKPTIIKDRVIELRKGAILAFEATTLLRDCVFWGEGVVAFYQAHGSRMDRCVFDLAGSNQVRIIASHAVGVNSCRFIGRGNTGELLWVGPGHQWQFEGRKWYHPNARYDAGTNNGGHVNPLTAIRRVQGSGTDRLVIPIAPPLEPAFYPEEWADQSVHVWGPGIPEDVRFKVVGYDGGLIVEPRDRWPDDQFIFPRGELYWQTWREAGFVDGFRLKDCSFVGPGKWSGFTGYWLRGFDIEGNNWVGFDDYGGGVEYGADGRFVDNVGSWNQYKDEKGKTWDQSQLVAMIRPCLVEGNVGMVGNLNHGYESLGFAREQVRPPIPQKPDSATPKV